MWLTLKCELENHHAVKLHGDFPVLQFYCRTVLLQCKNSRKLKAGKFYARLKIWCYFVYTSCVLSMCVMLLQLLMRPSKRNILMPKHVDWYVLWRYRGRGMTFSDTLKTLKFVKIHHAIALTSPISRDATTCTVWRKLDVLRDLEVAINVQIFTSIGSGDVVLQQAKCCHILCILPTVLKTVLSATAPTRDIFSMTCTDYAT
jgi:hypothetical protein